MTSNDGARAPSDGRLADGRLANEETEAGKALQLQQPAASERSAGSRMVLGSLFALIVLAGAIYYFVEDRSGVATAPDATQSAGNAPGTTQPLAENSKNPSAAPAPQPALPQTPSPAASSTQRSPPAAAPPAEAKAPPATPAQTATNSAPPQAGKKPDEVQSRSASGTPPAATTLIPAAQPPMRDKAAALPDQPAAAPKNETTLVVKLGPANIRSEPGKRGRVVATIAKDTQVKELGRSGSWVEVETDSGRGWIGGRLLGPREAEGR